MAASSLKVRYNVLAAAVLSAMAGPGLAANVTWIGLNDSYWDLPGNWNSGLPGALDDALLGAFNTELRSGAFNILSLTGTGRLTLSGGSLTFGNASAVGALAMTGGTLAGAGVLTISGASTWTAGQHERDRLDRVQRCAGAERR